MDIAERIKKLREAFGITSNELAKITGIHPVSIRKYETKKMVPGIEVIDKMCAALKLPRTIFEGIPEQYINYDFVGDFYQTILMLMECGAMDIDYKPADGSKDFSRLLLNSKLSQYMEIKVGDKVIPLDDLSIILKDDSYNTRDAKRYFDYYQITKKQLTDAQNKKEWDSESEFLTRDEYIEFTSNLADEYQLKMFLQGHSWKQYMSGPGGDYDDIHSNLESFVLAGGDYYGFIEQADMPDSEKEKYIKSYEDAYIDEIIKPEYILSKGAYPHGKSMDERDDWAMGLMEIHKQYKIDHPDYVEAARKHAADNARIARENYARDHKED